MDIVITWVDANNKEWLDEKAHWHYLFKGTQANHVANYSSFDEIKYVLRSIEKYMPHYRHIYLVTNNGSIPKWLKQTPKISIIDYRDLMPNNISTYNSNAIESQLYKIPNLSEYFLYFDEIVSLTCFPSLRIKPSPLSFLDLKLGGFSGRALGTVEARAILIPLFLFSSTIASAVLTPEAMVA